MTRGWRRSWPISGSRKTDKSKRSSGPKAGCPMTDQAIESPQGAAAHLPRKVSTRRGGVAVAGALAAIGILFVWQASRLDLGSIALPGPGFFPLVLAVLVVAFAIVIAIDRWRTPANEEAVELGHRDVLIVIAASLVVPLLFDPLGA